MIRFYIAIFIFTSIGLITGYLIKPKRNEVALMYFKDRNYGQAEKLYKDLLEEGHYTPEVINSLAKLNLEEGDIEKSIKLLKNFIKENPHSIVALKELARYYKNAQQPRMYMKTLRKIVELEPNPKIIEKLSNLYKDFNMLEDQVAILKNRIKTDPKNISEDDYIQLIVYQATKQNYKEALNTVNTFIDNNVADLSLDFVSLAISVAIDAKQDKRAYKIAEIYTEGDPENRARPVMMIFVDAGKMELAHKYITMLISKYKPNDIYKIMNIELYVMNGQYSKAYTILKRRMDSGKPLTTSEINMVALLALKFSDMERALKILDIAKVNTLHNNVVIEYIEASIINKNEEIAIKLNSKLTKEYLKNSKAISFLLSFALKNQDITKFVKGAIDKTYLTNDEKMIITKICLKNNKNKLAYEIQKTVPISFQLANLSPSTVADQILNFGDTTKEINVINQLITKTNIADPSPIIKTLLLLLAGSGMGVDIDKLLTKYPSISPSSLSEAYFISNKFKHFDVSIKIAKLLAEKFPNDESNTYVAESLIKQRKYNLAIKCLERLYNTDSYALSLYMQALMQIIKNSDNQKSKEITNSINTFIKMVDTSTFDDEQIRDFGYFFTDIGYTAQAKKIFYSLAESSDKVTDDTRQLVFLMGYPLDREDKKWLTTKANKAPNKDLHLWFELLSTKSLYSEIIAIYNKRSHFEINTLPYYLEALYYKKDYKKIDKIVEKINRNIYEKLTVDELLKLIGILGKSGHTEIAQQLFNEVPENKLLASENITDIVELFEKTGKIDYGLKLFSSILGDKLNDASNKIAVAWAMLAACGNKQKKLLEWLKSANNITPPIIEDLYFTSMKYKHIRLTYSLAKKLYNIKKSLPYTGYLVQAQIDMKDYKAAIDTLLNTKDLNKSLRLLYLNALSLYIENNGAKIGEKYINLFKNIAKQLLNSSAITKDIMRQIGYIESDLGMKNSARDIFFKLASDRNSKREDLSQLLYLCENNIPLNIKQWLIEQANNGNSDQQWKWLKIMNENGMAEDVYKLITSNKEQNKLAIIDQYLQALRLTKRIKLLKTALQNLPDSTIEKLNLDQKVSLTILLSEASYKKRAKKLFTSLTLNDVIERLTPTDLFQLLKVSGMIEYGESILRQDAMKYGVKTKKGEIWAYLATSLDKRSELLNILSAKDVPEYIPVTCFYIALNHKYKQLSLSIAELLLQNNKSPKNKRIFAEALILNKQFNNAIKTITKLNLNKDENQNLYITAISGLIEEKGLEAVKPYLLQIKKVAQDLYNKAKTDDKKRTIGYLYSDLNLTDKARDIFFDLAKNQKAESNDVKQLIYLWNSKPWAKGSEWLLKRAKAAKGKEQLLWLKYMNTTGNANMVIKVLEGDESK